jgi:hypothetical protein
MMGRKRRRGRNKVDDSRVRALLLHRFRSGD